MNPLVRVIPAFFVRLFARPYVAGDSLQKAMEVVQRLHRERDLLATLDLLAEDIRTEEQARSNLDTYLAMVDAEPWYEGPNRVFHRPSRGPGLRLAATESLFEPARAF